MTGAEFATRIRNALRYNSTRFTDAELLSIANSELEILAQRIEAMKGDFFEFNFTDDLVASQRNYGFPDDMLSSMKIVQIKLNGTDFVRAYPMDLNQYRSYKTSSPDPLDRNLEGYSSDGFSGATIDEASIIENFSDDYPVYDISGNELVFYTGSTIPEQTDGILLVAKAWPTKITDTDLEETSDDMSKIQTTTETRLPRQFHSVLAKMVVNEKLNEDSRNLLYGEDKIEMGIQLGTKSVSRRTEEGVVIPTMPVYR